MFGNSKLTSDAKINQNFGHLCGDFTLINLNNFYAKLSTENQSGFLKVYNIDIMQMSYVNLIRKKILKRLNCDTIDVPTTVTNRSSFDDFYDRISRSIFAGFNENVSFMTLVGELLKNHSISF